MAGKIRVMIVDDISETREQLKKLLSFDPDIEVVAMAPSGEEAVANVMKAMPDVILMDINLPGIDGIVATGKIIESLPPVQVIMLSVQGDHDYMRKAMMAGARDYLTKPPTADDLLGAIQRAYKQRQKMGTGPLTAPAAAGSRGAPAPAKLREGKIITVYSAKGGTGCTTIAVNLAIALQAASKPDTKICLIDSNLQFGDVSVFMKLQSSRTITDLAQHAQDLDPDLLNPILVPHPSGIKILLPPPTPEDTEIFRDGGIDDTGANIRFKAILEFARDYFDYLIIDTAHQIDDILQCSMDTCDLFLVVTRPIIPEIRGARMFIELLQKVGYAMQKVGLVINGVDNKRLGIQPEAIERAMMPALVHIPYDDPVALRAANYGEPIMMKNARTPIGLAISKLAKTIQDRFNPNPDETSAAEEAPKRAGIGRLL